MDAHPIEKEIGINTYSTQENGVKGKLRIKFEDFIVEEITTNGKILHRLNKTDLNINNLPKTQYTLNLVLEKVNLETMALIHQLASHLRIPIKNIGFAGLKDKRAITVQKISLSGADLNLLPTFQKRGMYLNRISLGKPIKLGDLNGNHFHIILRQVNGSFNDIKKRIERIKEHILSSYVPNYYGPQRFGALRPISHKIGRALLLNDFEDALKIYLTDVFPEEDLKIKEIRIALRDTWHHSNLIFPKQYFYENKIMQGLKDFDLNFEKVFKKVFPTRFFLLFIHAYQSYLFNHLLNARIEAKLPFDQAFEGDFVVILNQYSLPTRVIYEVTSKNITSLNNAITKGKALVMAPLFGYDLNYSHHPSADYIAHLIEEEKIDLTLFKSTSSKKPPIKVIYRPVLFRPKGLDVSLNQTSNAPKDIYVTFDFSLNKGCYATILLREFMKTSPLYY